jgi:hypothetical protein
VALPFTAVFFTTELLSANALALKHFISAVQLLVLFSTEAADVFFDRAPLAGSFMAGVFTSMFQTVE